MHLTQKAGLDVVAGPVADHRFTAAAWTRSTELIWCTLLRNDAKTASFPGARGVLNTTVVTAVAGAPLPKYCVDLGEEPGDAQRFSNWLLTDRENVTAGEMQTMAPWSSCA